MSSVQPNLEQLSLKISEVLDDIGVNDETIQKRRQAALFQEQVFAFKELVEGGGQRLFRFGSQSEGTTTVGMKSDEDILLVTYDPYNVINDFSSWQTGKMNILMVRDETSAPGYCLLQLLRNDVPKAEECFSAGISYTCDKGRALIKNKLSPIDDRFAQHGPATSMKREGMKEMDGVLAYYCSKWPVEGKKWLTRDNVDGWPNASLKSKCEKSGCFLVPVDSKISGIVGVEWRISTSIAERYLMFSLNTTHLKCYVIMKLLLKTFTVFHDVISSYMCKTVLLYCVENTMVEFWQENNLIRCLSKLLNELCNCIANLNCPHFIIPENNLMAGRISPLQQQKLLEVLDEIIKSEGEILLDVQIDDLGDRIRQKLNHFPLNPEGFLKYVLLKSKIETHRFISGELSYYSADCVFSSFIGTLKKFRDLSHENSIQKMKLKYKEVRKLYPQFDITKRRAARHFTSLMRTTIGTLMASFSISTLRPMTSYSILNKSVFGKNTTLEWLESGLNSDVSSSLLKLATVYYSSGDMNSTVDLLTLVDQTYDRNVVIPTCSCTKEGCLIIKNGLIKVANKSQVTKFRHIVSYCVFFMYHDIHIVPSELRQEFFRSSQEELQRRLPPDEDWMDSAVIDSLPYLYFLQYKTYSSLGQNEDKQNALEKLKNVTNEEPGQLSHTETVYNLLGQCMDQENRPNDALKYYQQSLQIRPEHNAANIYISRLKR